MNKSRKVTVLVVDDDDTVRCSLAGYLEDKNFIVFACSRVTEGLCMLTDHPVDVAIVDIRLPERDGNTFIKEAHKIRPETKYIVYTGLAGYSLPKAFSSIGIEEGQVLKKPVPDLSLISDTILRLVGMG